MRQQVHPGPAEAFSRMTHHAMLREYLNQQPKTAIAGGCVKTHSCQEFRDTQPLTRFAIANFATI